MLRSGFSAVVVVCLLLGVSSAWADRGPSTEEERARVVRLSIEAKTDPLKVYTSDGRWFSKWLDEVPDLSFGPEAPAEWMENNAKGDLRRIAVFAYALGGVSYMVQHQVSDPRKTPDQLVAIHAAALEEAVRAYGAIRSLKPENRSEAFDAALEKLNKGEFDAFVKSLFGKKK